MRRAAIGARGRQPRVRGVVLVLCAVGGAAPIDVAGSYLFPHRYAIEVRPGSIKVREGEPVTVMARIPGIDGGLVPMLTVGRGDAARSARMTPGPTPGRIHDHAEQHHGRRFRTW